MTLGELIAWHEARAASCEISAAGQDVTAADERWRPVERNRARKRAAELRTRGAIHAETAVHLRVRASR